jgi:hypothetical protein
MSKISWTSRYNIHRAQVGAVGTMIVAWEREGYTVHVFNTTLAEKAPDLEAGKRMAVAIARQLLDEAAKALDA